MNSTETDHTKHVVIIGAGFAGLNCARGLGNQAGVRVTILDRRNHHLFQPLLYQVAMAGLSPADIAAPIRSILSSYKNIQVLMSVVDKIDCDQQVVHTDAGPLTYDYLVVAAGAKHHYFGKNHWEEFAPGLKTLSQATEIRRRVLIAFEKAEKCRDKEKQKQLLTFVIVGGGPTGVELAGAVGEMSRYTLSKEFRNIDSRHTRIILIEGGERILPQFKKRQSAHAARVLEKLGVQVWTNSIVSDLNAEGVWVGEEFIKASTILWGAGVRASSLTEKSGWPTDKIGRALVNPDLSLKDYDNVFVAGDMANCPDKKGNPLPGLAPVALQQGRFLAKLITNILNGKKREAFQYFDKGQMATIGKSQAVLESGGIQMRGFVAWLGWLFIHILFLNGMKNRFFVMLNWAWSYLNFKRGARLIVRKEWKFFS